jgi:hypothetical protein
MTRAQLHRELTVATVHRSGADVDVEVVDTAGVAHRIRFHFADGETAEAQRGAIQHWKHERRLVTYVRHRGDAALLDEAELFQRASRDDTIA